MSTRAHRIPSGVRVAYPTAVAALPGFRVTTVGHIERKDHPQFTPVGRRLDGHGLFLFHAGGGPWRTEQAQGRIDAGSLLLLRSGQWHCFDPDAGSFLTESWLVFDGPLADRLLATLAPPGQCHFHIADLPRLAERWRELIDLALLGMPTMDLRVTSLAIDLLVDALGSARTPGPDDDAIAAFTRCADAAACAAECPLPAFLAREGLTFETFRKAFRRRTGLFPRQYWQQRKLDRARILLSHSHETVGRIAQATGFTDIYHFSRWFRRLAGRPPSAFRALSRARTAAEP
jgi:AraC-like DNA-binding protein